MIRSPRLRLFERGQRCSSLSFSRYGGQFLPNGNLVAGRWIDSKNKIFLKYERPDTISIRSQLDGRDQSRTNWRGQQHPSQRANLYMKQVSCQWNKRVSSFYSQDAGLISCLNSKVTTYHESSHILLESLVLISSYNSHNCFKA